MATLRCRSHHGLVRSQLRSRIRCRASYCSVFRVNAVDHCSSRGKKRGGFFKVTISINRAFYCCYNMVLFIWCCNNSATPNPFSPTACLLSDVEGIPFASIGTPLVNYNIYISLNVIHHPRWCAYQSITWASQPTKKMSQLTNASQPRARQRPRAPPDRGNRLCEPTPRRTEVARATDQANRLCAPRPNRHAPIESIDPGVDWVH
jgi:hypothetical protein